jgi:pimeloyl-ACP methyl ester carboxylesterase
VGPELGRDFRVIAFDHPGFGDSEWDPSGSAYTAEGFAADLEEFRKILKLDRLALVGHSFGGRVALAYACSHPLWIRAVILVDSAPEIDPKGAFRARQYLARIPNKFSSIEEAMAFFGPIYPRYSEEQLRRRLELYLTAGAEEGFRVKRDPAIGERYRQIVEGKTAASAPDWASLRQAKCPVLVLRGERSDLVTPQVVKRMNLENPTIEVTEIPEAGHLIPTECPMDVVAEVRRFLSALE